MPLASKPGLIPHLCAFSHTSNGLLRLTFGVTPTDCIVLIMAVKSFGPMYLQMYPQTFEPMTKHATAHRSKPFGHSSSP